MARDACVCAAVEVREVAHPDTEDLAEGDILPRVKAQPGFSRAVA